MSTFNLRSSAFKIMLHTLFWVLYLLMPLLFIENLDNHRLAEFTLRSILLVVFFYLNTTVLIPIFFTRRKFLTYSLLIFLCFIVIIVSNEIIHYELHPGNRKEFNHIYYGMTRAFFSSLIVFGISFSFKITGEWAKSEQKMKNIENDKLSAELSLLKSQVNPHFLFNTLNNIYSLAYKKSDDAPTAIVKLSHLMRYMLYDSNVEKVQLSKEVEYLENYIDLQKLRLQKANVIKFSVKGNTDFVQIEPMLLIPFVENAFKHGISSLETSDIEISLQVNSNFIIFTVLNLINRNLQNCEQPSGFGLSNVMRRLELLYPSKHEINIVENATDYAVNLKIYFQK